MVQRSDIIALLEEIKKCKAGTERLCSNDFLFLQDITTQASHYGYMFSEKQSKRLQEVYRRVYENVEG
jgi:hypothetical protein